MLVPSKWEKQEKQTWQWHAGIQEWESFLLTHALQRDDEKTLKVAGSSDADGGEEIQSVCWMDLEEGKWATALTLLSNLGHNALFSIKVTHTQTHTQKTSHCEQSCWVQCVCVIITSDHVVLWVGFGRSKSAKRNRYSWQEGCYVGLIICHSHGLLQWTLQCPGETGKYCSMMGMRIVTLPGEKEKPILISKAPAF